MGKIVIHRHAIGFTAQLKTATSVDERAQCIGRIRRHDANMTRGCNRHQAVVHVVLAHQAPLNFADFFTVQPHFPLGGIGGQLFRLPVTLFAHQLLFAPAAHRHRLFQIDVVFRVDDASLARHDTHQVMELFLNSFQIVKDVRVIELKVIEDQRARAVMHEFRTFVEERTVVLIRFNHEEVALAEARGNLKVARNAADHKARFIAAGFEDPGRHSGGSGFAVRTRNRQYPAIAQDKVMQPLRARHVRNVLFQHRFHARITTGHGIANDHQVRLWVELAGIVTLNQINALLLK